MPSAAKGQAIPPAPTRWVTDAAGWMSPTAVNALDERLAAYEHQTGHQVYVWIGKTLGGGSIDEWAARTFASWKVGRKGIDDGLVLFVLRDDRTARIEVGYGLEGQVPDAVAGRILRESLFPKLEAGEPNAGITDSVDEILKTIGGEDGRPSARTISVFQSILILIAIVAFVIFAIRHPVLAYYLLTTIANRSGGSQGGARGGGGRSGGGGASGKW